MRKELKILVNRNNEKSHWSDALLLSMTSFVTLGAAVRKIVIGRASTESRSLVWVWKSWGLYVKCWVHLFWLSFTFLALKGWVIRIHGFKQYRHPLPLSMGRKVGFSCPCGYCSIAASSKAYKKLFKNSPSCKLLTCLWLHPSCHYLLLALCYL